MAGLILIPKERHWAALEQRNEEEIRRACSRQRHYEVNDPSVHRLDGDSEKKYGNGELDHRSRGGVGHFAEPPEL